MVHVYAWSTVLAHTTTRIGGGKPNLAGRCLTAVTAPSVSGYGYGEGLRSRCGSEALSRPDVTTARRISPLGLAQTNIPRSSRMPLLAAPGIRR